MRQLFAAAVIVVAAVAVRADNKDEPIPCKAEGLHVCCKSCEDSINGVLAKVDGVGDVAVDRKNKTVTFTAKTAKAGEEALTALLNGGFHCSMTVGDKKIAVTAKVPDLMGDEITVSNVHACCGACKTAIKAALKDVKDAKVTFTGKGQVDVTVAGKNVDAAAVVRALESAGFHGSVAEKKK